MAFDMHPVSSSNVSEIGWDVDTHILQVSFHGGATYQYMAVPEDVYQAFMAAPSKGKFVWEVLRGNRALSDIAPYQYIRIS